MSALINTLADSVSQPCEYCGNRHRVHCLFDIMLSFHLNVFQVVGLIFLFLVILGLVTLLSTSVTHSPHALHMTGTKRMFILDEL